MPPAFLLLLRSARFYKSDGLLFTARNRHGYSCNIYSYVQLKTEQLHLYGQQLGFAYLNAGLPAVSPCASERSCDRATRSMIAVVFLSPRENADLASKRHVALISALAVLLPLP